MDAGEVLPSRDRVVANPEVVLRRDRASDERREVRPWRRGEDDGERERPRARHDFSSLREKVEGAYEAESWRASRDERGGSGGDGLHRAAEAAYDRHAGAEGAPAAEEG